MWFWPLSAVSASPMLLSALCLVLRDVKPRKLRPAWEEADRLGGTVNGEDSDLNDARDYAEAVDP